MTPRAASGPGRAATGPVRARNNTALTGARPPSRVAPRAASGPGRELGALAGRRAAVTRPRRRAEPRDPIDHLLALDLAGRGLGALVIPGAAGAAARALARARRVLVVTGFAVARDTPETDGPPGAAVLGHALHALGAAVTYVTDAAGAAPLRASLDVLRAAQSVEVSPGGPAAAADLLRKHRPTHLVAIERPGRTRDGRYLNARGRDVGAWNPPLDALFLAPGLRGRRADGRAVTVGVGDGGNEIGMGGLARRLRRTGGVLGRIASAVRTDHLVVAGTSNWGAYGIVAGLERLLGKRLLHDPDTELRLIAACVAAGAVDGLTLGRAASVDSLPAEVHAAMVALFRRAACEVAERRSRLGAARSLPNNTSPSGRPHPGTPS